MTKDSKPDERWQGRGGVRCATSERMRQYLSFATTIRWHVTKPHSTSRTEHFAPEASRLRVTHSLTNVLETRVGRHLGADVQASKYYYYHCNNCNCFRTEHVVPEASLAAKYLLDKTLAISKTLDQDSFSNLVEH